ncbi:unannotated protein [freshwater metagenome]|uniref:Unannotated protein n=1 Tax=freshwater metagenome TaxID=449393 RepID=A0A6J6Z5I7_9ZZZZ
MGARHQVFQVVDELPEIPVAAAALLELRHGIGGAPLPRRLPGQAVDEPAEAGTDQKVVRVDGQEREGFVGLHHAQVNPIGDGDFHLVHLALGSLADHPVLPDERTGIHLAAFPPGCVGDRDGGHAEAAEGRLHLFVLAAPVLPAAEFEDVGHARPVDLCGQTGAEALLGFQPVAAYFLGQVGHHVEENVVVEHGGEAGLIPAFYGDEAVFQLVADHPEAGRFTQGKGGHVHQVHVVLDRGVVDRGDEKHELGVVVRGVPENLLGRKLLHQRRANIHHHIRVTDGFTQAPERAVEVVVGAVRQLEVGPYPAGIVPAEAAERVLVQDAVFPSLLGGEGLRQPLEIGVLFR